MTVESVLAEMAKTTISYCGEEVLPLLPLSVAQMEPGLPAYGHGGQIDSMQFVSGRTKLLLANPAECILPVANRESGPTQAKVHARPGEELAVCQLLVERNVCLDRFGQCLQARWSSCPFGTVSNPRRFLMAGAWCGP